MKLVAAIGLLTLCSACQAQSSKIEVYNPGSTGKPAEGATWQDRSVHRSRRVDPGAVCNSPDHADPS